jgi:2'-5' RNA ligase
MANPIILTVLFDEETQGFIDDERERWFVPRLNRIPGHLTLFHKLPGEEAEEIGRLIEMTLASREPFRVVFSKPFLLGGGVAYRAKSEDLEEMRSELAEAFGGWLTDQDRQSFRPHVTVQNKVTPATAKASLKAIEEDFTPFEAEARGVKMWSYEGGPWKEVRELPFGTGSG